MYILIKESVPVGFAVNAAAHGSLVCYLKYTDHPDMVEWLKSSFRKVTCKVTDEEFEKIKAVGDHVVITESALNGQEVALVFVPRWVYPPHFKFFRMYK